MKDKIRFAVVGCGHIGKRHAEMISRNQECILVSIADIRPEIELGMEKYRAQYFNSLDALISQGPPVDVVVIATPNGLHFEQGLKVIASGAHLVVEKPMALSSFQAKKMIAEAELQGVNIFVVMQNRFSPPATWLKNIVDSGILGKIYMVQLNCFWNRDSRYYTAGSWRGTRAMDGGTLFTQFSHFIDIMFWLFGGISNVRSKLADFSHGTSTEFEDTGIVTFDMDNGGIGALNFTTSVWDRNFENSLTVIAEKGSVKIGGQYLDVIESCHISECEMPVLPPTSPVNDYGAYKGSASNHHFIVDNIVGVLHRGASVCIDPEEGAAVIEIIEKMYAAEEQRQITVHNN